MMGEEKRIGRLEREIKEKGEESVVEEIKKGEEKGRAERQENRRKGG